jgi:hypothetical protein
MAQVWFWFLEDGPEPNRCAARGDVDDEQHPRAHLRAALLPGQGACCMSYPVPRAQRGALAQSRPRLRRPTVSKIAPGFHSGCPDALGRRPRWGGTASARPEYEPREPRCLLRRVSRQGRPECGRIIWAARSLSEA